MALFGRDYDRDFGHGGGMWNRGLWDRGGYDRMYGSGRDSGRDRPYLGTNRGFYDRDFGAAGYDRGYKSRWQTDHGDPFGDRSARTPMRVIRGEFHGYDRNFMDHDRGFAGNQRMTGWNDAGYDRDHYASSPRRYEPGMNRQGTWGRDHDPSFRRYDRDMGWF